MKKHERDSLIGKVICSYNYNFIEWYNFDVIIGVYREHDFKVENLISTAITHMSDSYLKLPSNVILPYDESKVIADIYHENQELAEILLRELIKEHQTKKQKLNSNSKN
jgi:hypothetical protein